MAASTFIHMSPEELYRWSGPYQLIDDMNAVHLRETADYAELAGAESAPAHPSEALRERLLSAIGRARTDNG